MALRSGWFGETGRIAWACRAAVERCWTWGRKVSLPFIASATHFVLDFDFFIFPYCMHVCHLLVWKMWRLVFYWIPALSQMRPSMEWEIHSISWYITWPGFQQCIHQNFWNLRNKFKKDLPQTHPTSAPLWPFNISFKNVFIYRGTHIFIFPPEALLGDPSQKKSRSPMQLRANSAYVRVLLFWGDSPYLSSMIVRLWSILKQNLLSQVPPTEFSSSSMSLSCLAGGIPKLISGALHILYHIFG